MSAHGTIRDLLPLYVLGALDGTPDCEAVCAHLATGCITCTAELAEHAETAAAIATAEPPVAPGAGVRAALEKRLASAPREESSPSAKVIVFPRARMATAVAAAAAIAASLAAFYFQDSLRRERNESFLAGKQLVESESKARELQEALNRDHDVLAALGGESSVFDLAPQKEQQGRGRVVWDRTHRRWILLASGLKPLPADKAYELWFIAGDRKIPAGVFRPDASGNARHIVELPAGLQKIDVGAVTLEPASGVQAPTGPIG